MKFSITFKDPDGVYDSIREQAEESMRSLDLSSDEFYEVREKRAERMLEFASRWLEYSEYVTVEFDTEANTATVKELR